MKSTVIQCKSWHAGAGIEGTGRKTQRLEEVGDGAAEVSSAAGGPAATSLTPDADGMLTLVFESSQLECLYVRGLTVLRMGRLNLAGLVSAGFLFKDTQQKGNCKHSHFYFLLCVCVCVLASFPNSQNTSLR